MDTELAALEEKILQAVQLCKQLREENRDLRQQLVAAQSVKKQLSQKIDHARDRLENLLKRMPDQTPVE